MEKAYSNLLEENEKLREELQNKSFLLENVLKSTRTSWVMMDFSINKVEFSEGSKKLFGFENKGESVDIDLWLNHINQEDRIKNY